MIAPSASSRSPQSRPLLKWAGGKRQLLPTLRQHYPAQFTRYIEPFLGSGAVFFDLFHAGRLAGRRVRLVDANPDLIDCYRTLRDDPEAVIREVEKLARGHRQGGSEFYYEVRDRRFNPARLAGTRGTPELAAMLIYLNRTGFNGLYRLNRRGEFNVPAGRYADPRVSDPEHLRRVAATLAATGVTLEYGSFEIALSDAGAGDFVYCDPPYAPLSPTAAFAHYTAGGFSELDQARLQRHVVAAAARGATVVLSNSSAPIIERLYRAPEARKVGLDVQRVPARRAINSRAALRGAVDELLVTNAQRITGRGAKLPMARATLKTAARKRA
jgi:DNA adenine methylase